MLTYIFIIQKSIVLTKNDLLILISFRFWASCFPNDFPLELSSLPLSFALIADAVALSYDFYLSLGMTSISSVLI